jgi:hypothetical protein
MARSKGAVYSGSLKLDRVTGIRHDLGQRMTYVPVKKESKLEQPPRAMKTSSNITNDGLKKS